MLHYSEQGLIWKETESRQLLASMNIGGGKSPCHIRKSFFLSYEEGLDEEETGLMETLMEKRKGKGQPIRTKQAKYQINRVPNPFHTCIAFHLSGGYSMC